MIRRLLAGAGIALGLMLAGNLVSTYAGGEDPGPRAILRVDKWPHVTVRFLPDRPGTWEVAGLAGLGDPRTEEDDEWVVIESRRLREGQWLQFDVDASQIHLIAGGTLGIRFERTGP